MKNPKSPQGKVHQFLPVDQWDDDGQFLPIPRSVRSRPAVVLMKSKKYDDCVYVASVTEEIHPSVSQGWYVPIAPVPKDYFTDMQLHMENYLQMESTLLSQSYLRTDTIYEVPLRALERKYDDYGMPLELEQESYDQLRTFLVEPDRGLNVRTIVPPDVMKERPESIAKRQSIS
ncbi:hypothetical protein J3E68DRAFT_307844 [Trichoderma sp. SZMC 28012]